MYRSRFCMSSWALIFLFFLGCSPTMMQLKKQCEEEEDRKTCRTYTQRLQDQCDNSSDGKSCFELAMRNFQGKSGQMNEEMLKASLALLTKGCELDYAKACSAKNQLVQEVQKIIDNVRQAGLKQLETAADACINGSVEACRLVVPTLQQGCAQKSEDMCDKLVKVFRKLCDMGSEEHCLQYGSVEERLCKAGDECACGEVGRLLVYPRPPIRPNRRQGIEMLRVGCRKSCGVSCQILKELGVSP